jgi:hypothetical protein
LLRLAIALGIVYSGTCAIRSLIRKTSVLWPFVQPCSFGSVAGGSWRSSTPLGAPPGADPGCGATPGRACRAPGGVLGSVDCWLVLITCKVSGETCRTGLGQPKAPTVAEVSSWGSQASLYSAADRALGNIEGKSGMALRCEGPCPERRSVRLLAHSVTNSSGSPRPGWPTPAHDSYLVDSASSHMLVSKIKPCMSKYKQLYGETANGSLNQLSFI